MQFLINGFIAGSLTALVAIAFQSVYLPTRVFFIGLAGIYAVTPFIAYSVIGAGGPWPVAVIASILLPMLISLLCELLNHGPLARRRASEGAHLVSSLGTYIVLLQIITMIWGSNTHTLRTGIESVTVWGNVVITRSQWIALATSMLVIFAFSAVLMGTELGLRIRAISENPVQFALFGYNISAYRLLAFGISGSFAAISSLLASYDGAFDPYIGLQAVLLAVVAVIIGGRDSFAGPIVAAFLLCVLRASIVWNFSPRWQEALTFALLGLFLLFRPQGLIGSSLPLQTAASRS